MKKRVLSLVLVLLMVLSVFSIMPLSVSAATEYKSGYYTYILSNNQATIIDVEAEISGRVEIPSYVNGYTVIGIGNYAFSSCDSLTSVVIPDTVESIGYSAFHNCDALTTVTLGNRVAEIGQSAFAYCPRLKSIVIPDSVTYMGVRVFESCGSLTTATIGSGLYEIPSSAFNGCTGLTTLIINSGIETIGSSAFSGCDSLNAVEIPKTVKNIENDAFYGCDSLTTVTLGNGVTKIGQDAFSCCSRLESITIPDNVIEMGARTFYKCTSLSDVNIGSGLHKIPYEAFYDCGKLTRLAIKNGIETIGPDAFAYCENLVEVVIPDSVKTIDTGAFFSNKALTKVIFGKNLTEIGSAAFLGCVNLESIMIPDEVTEVGIEAFGGCLNLKTAIIGSSLNEIPYDMFELCSSLSSVEISKTVTSISDSAFTLCDNLTDIYYLGNQSDWNNIAIGNYNDELLNATIHYNSKMPSVPTEPSEPAFKDDGIAVLTTEKSFSVKTGESFWLAFGMIDGESGKLKGDWKKMSIVVSDPSVVSLSEYEATEYGYSLEVKGKKKGSTNLVVTDAESGECITILVRVYDEFSKTYSYKIDDIASFYPQNKWEDHIATNIYDLNGIYINNYSCYKSGSKYIVSFDAYNHRYHTGAVDIYDANGDWLNSVAIDKYSDMASIWDTGEQLFYLVSNLTKYIPGGEESNLLTYEQESVAKHTKITFEVPNGGYFTISNNIKESPGAYLFNTSELLFDAVVSFVDLSIKGVEPSDFAKLVIDELAESPSLRKTFIESFEDTAVKEISGFAKNYMKNGLEDGCTDLVNDYEDLLNSLDIDWKHLASSATGVAESVFTKVSGPAGAILSVYFSVMDGSNKLHQVSHMAKSIDEAYVTVYTNIDSGMINPHGVYIDTNGNVDKETVLQVFRVSNDDTIEVVLDSDNPLEKYELYNISFIKNDEQVQPNGKVKVHIPIPNGMKSNTCKIYRQESDGTWTILNARVEGNYLVFETEHFSLYAVIGDAEELKINSFPSQMTYTVGDILNTDGLVLEYRGSLIDSGFVCMPTVITELGEQTIKVRYGNAMAKFIVTVETVSNHVFGDANIDGKVNIKDATLIQKHIAALVTMNEEQLSVSDVNLDGKVNVKDATYIQKFIAGLVSMPEVDVENNTSTTIEPESIVLDNTSLTLNVGESNSLIATVLPDNAVDKSILWSTSDDTIVSVNNGVIKAEKIGVAVITAETANGIKASCNVTVTPIEAEYVTLNTYSLTLKVGEESILTPTIHPESVTDKELTLTSSDTSVVIVAGRIISAVGVGNATITVSTSNGKYAVCEVTVEEVDASNITLSSNNIEMDIGDTYNLIATVEPSDVTDKSIVWTTSDSTIATVDKGLVNAKGSGTATITAQTANGLEAVCEITVYMPVSGVYELFLNLRKNPGGCYRLTTDDTLNSLDVNLDTFTGCINGDGHTITINYDVTSKDVTEDCYKALLPKSDGAIIKNLNISGTIDHEMYSDGSYSNYCAGFVAYAENTTFINCTNEATIKEVVWSDYSGYGYVGGITAWSENCEFINCTNKGDLQITAMPTRIASSIAGGISGQSSNSKFDTCSNTGNVGTHSSNISDTYYSIAYSGGIVGSSDCSDLTNCVTSGNLMANAWPNYETYYTSVAASGGIVAYGNGNLENCSSSCKLNPSATNGGAVYKGELIAYKN